MSDSITPSFNSQRGMIPKIARVADRFAEPFPSILYGMGLGCMLRKRQAHEATR
jgi:hypothetical protein